VAKGGHATAVNGQPDGGKDAAEPPQETENNAGFDTLEALLQTCLASINVIEALLQAGAARGQRAEAPLKFAILLRQPIKTHSREAVSQLPNYSLC
jgi:hypothetical protein